MPPEAPLQAIENLFAGACLMTPEMGGWCDREVFRSFFMPDGRLESGNTLILDGGWRFLFIHEMEPPPTIPPEEYPEEGKWIMELREGRTQVIRFFLNCFCW